MNFVDPSVELVLEKDPYKKIELAGRTCYKSEAKITDDSANKFVKALIKREHYAMLEHQVFIFEILDDSLDKSYINFLKKDKYLNVTTDLINNHGSYKYRCLVSGNVRAICQRNVNDPIFRELKNKYPDLCFGDGLLVDCIYKDYYANIIDIEKEIDTFTINELINHVYYTFKIICDRGVTHELVRHRSCSFAQESTRYVNYKNGISIIIPSGFYDKSLDTRLIYQKAFESAEKFYHDLIEYHGQTPQQARAVLPTAIKSEIIITTNLKEYIHILNLRYKGLTGAPHPDIKIIAKMINDLIIYNFYKNSKYDINYILNIDNSIKNFLIND